MDQSRRNETLNMYSVSRMDFHQTRPEATQEEMKAKMNTNQEEIKASREEMMADMKTQIGCLASRINVNQEETTVKSKRHPA
jgi:hypothetical protein